MDKNKIIEGAAKLVAKGAYDKAIKEYQKVLEADPKDVRTLQKMGELYQKKGDNSQAAFYFTKVAESYSTDGFFLKAVALYKQVLKLDSSLIDVNLRLAELHQQLQLMSEAMAYYQIVANHYDKAGDTVKSLDTLKKMVDLDPDNIASRIKLAELYAREQMNGEAVGEFQRAAEHLKRNNRIDDYLRVAERIATLEPANLELAKELAEIYLQKSDQKRALAKLQVCFKADPRDIETLKLLATAFQGLGQTSKTISVFKELAKVYQESGRSQDAEEVWGKVASLDPNDPELKARQPAPTSAPVQIPTRPGAQAAPIPSGNAGNSGSYAATTGSAKTALAPPYQPRGGANTPGAPAVAPPPRQDPAANALNLSKLLTETDVYVKYGLHDKALEHLRRVFAVDPENLDAHEKAYHIYEAANQHAQAQEQLLNVLRLHTRHGDIARAQPYLNTILKTNPAHPEVPVFVASLRAPGEAVPGGTSGLNVQDEVAEDAILVDSSEEEIIVADGADDALALAAAQAPVDSRVSEVSQPNYELDAPVSDSIALQSAANYPEESITDEPLQSPPVHDLDAGEPEADPADVFERDPSGETVVGPPPTRDDQLTLRAGRAPSAIPSGFEMEPEGPTQVFTLPEDRQVEAVEGVDPAEFADDQDIVAQDVGDQDLIEEPLPPPVEDGFDSPATSELPAMAAEPGTPGYAHSETDFSEPSAAPYEEAVEAPPDEEPAQEECDEATFFIEQGLFEEAKEILDTVQIAYPGHRRATELMARVEAGMGGQVPQPPDAYVSQGNGVSSGNGVASGNGSNGVQHYDDGSVAASGNTESGRDAFDLAAELASELGGMEDMPSGVSEVPSEDFQVSVDEVFSEFKKGLQKIVKPEDVDTHYDLGIAYKEMGLLDDAIGEFETARKGAAGQRKEIDCLSMMAQLHLMKSDSRAAIDAYRNALGSMHASGEVEKALRYELGGAYEQADEPGKALGQYLKVQRLDGGYREVQTMVDRLSQVTGPEEEDPIKPRGPGGPGGAGGGGPGGNSSARKVGYV